MRKPPNETPRLSKSRDGNPKARSSRAKSRGERNGGSAPIPERKCILSGEHGARDSLIRLALGPDGSIAPDVRAKAPGRGAWIGVDRQAVEAAHTKGKLKGALARAFKTNDLSIPADLGEKIEGALRQAVLDRLGLEARAGTLITGSDKVETAARRGEVHLLIHASDAGEDGRRKLDQAWRAGEGGSQGVVFPAERPILSLALGRQNVVHVAIVDRAAAARVRHAIDRWRAFIATDDGLSARAAETPGASAVDVNEGLE